MKADKPYEVPRELLARTDIFNVARRTGLSQKTVRRAMARLTSAGLLCLED